MNKRRRYAAKRRRLVARWVNRVRRSRTYEERRAALLWLRENATDRHQWEVR